MMSVMSVSTVRTDGAGSGSEMPEKLTFVRLLHATTPNTRYSHTSTSRRHETHMPPTIEPTVPDEMDWKHWFSNLMAEGDANERLKREDPAAYEAKMRAAPHVQVLPLRRDLHGLRPQ